MTDDAGRVIRVTLVGDSNSNDNVTFLVAWNGHGDALGLWKINADGSLTLANSYTYSTWGAPSTTVASPFGDLGFRYLYVGDSDVQWDNSFSLGLLYMHARHYSPAIGRFLQPDPVRPVGDYYVYALNAPITMQDARGLLARRSAVHHKSHRRYPSAMIEGDCGAVGVDIYQWTTSGWVLVKIMIRGAPGNVEAIAWDSVWINWSEFWMTGNQPAVDAVAPWDAKGSFDAEDFNHTGRGHIFYIIPVVTVWFFGPPWLCYAGPFQASFDVQ